MYKLRRLFQQHRDNHTSIIQIHCMQQCVHWKGIGSLN